jgi:hypothetical protein
MNALGKYYAGSALVWQITPLWTMSQTLLLNWNDPSAYWIPSIEWSTTDNSSLLMAAQTGIGGAIQEDLTIQSEYGSVPTSLFVAFKWYW